MRVEHIITLLDCEVVEGGPDLGTVECDTFFAADLMSDVLAFSGPGGLLITGLTSVQSIHTANVADLKAILFVNGKRPEPAVLDLARERGLPLLTTRASMFHACGILYGQRPGTAVS